VLAGDQKDALLGGSSTAPRTHFSMRIIIIRRMLAMIPLASTKHAGIIVELFGKIV
jgi:hypothetical protein